jgi:hypothetical protein
MVIVGLRGAYDIIALSVHRGGLMHLKMSKNKRGRDYLSIVEKYRDGPRSRMRVVEPLGYLDDLEKIHKDPIAHFKARAKELTEAKAKENEPIVLGFYPKEKIDMRKDNVKNVGYAVLSAYYHKLAIGKFWDNRRMREGFAYNPNAIFKLLTYSRILDPGSKLHAFEGKGRLLDRMDFSLDDVYRALSFFAGYERDLIAWIDTAISGIKKRNTEAIYYDVTNYYFEIEQEDELRRRGVSRKHRPNPIIQMGLALDAGGIPLDYRLFEGNTNDSLTLLSVLKDLKRRHKASRMIVVADKGLNTSDNIAANMIDGNGFVFSQSVRHATGGLKDWITDDTGYTGGEAFRIKDRLAKKTVSVTTPEGKKKRIDVDVRQVVFWSADFARRAKAEREAVIEKSLNAVMRGGGKAAKAHTALRYVTDIAVNTKTGELADHVLSLNEKKIAEDGRMDGYYYYCIITSELEKDASEIIDIYRGLWKIEDTFRVTKSTLEYRPVYVSRHERIHAHFMICYVALVLLCLIEADLSHDYSIQEIVDDIASINGTLMDKNYYLFGHRSHLSDALGRLAGIDLSRKILSAKDMRDILAKTKKSQNYPT